MYDSAPSHNAQGIWSLQTTGSYNQSARQGDYVGYVWQCTFSQCPRHLVITDHRATQSISKTRWLCWVCMTVHLLTMPWAFGHYRPQGHTINQQDKVIMLGMYDSAPSHNALSIWSLQTTGPHNQSARQGDYVGYVWQCTFSQCPEHLVITDHRATQSISKTRWLCWVCMTVHLLTMPWAFGHYRPQGHTINQQDKVIMLGMYDSAPSHNALSIWSLQAKRNITISKQSPYSPDLVLQSFYLFSKLKDIIFPHICKGHLERRIDRAEDHSRRILSIVHRSLAKKDGRVN